jgi:hypothetical protein
MPAWLDIVQIIISDMIIFPSRRVMESMGPGVAPMPVQTMRSQSGSGAAKLENLVSRENGYLARQRLCFGCRDRSFSDRIFVRRRKRDIDEARRLLQDRFGRMQSDLQISDGCNREGIVACAFLPGIEPRTGVA